MKITTIGLVVLAALALAPTHALAVDGGGDNSTEQGPSSYPRPAGISSLPSTYESDATGFAIDTVRGGSIEGTMVFDRASRQYLYADGQMTRAGVLSSTQLNSMAGDLRVVYSEYKRSGRSCGRFAILCDIIEEVVENITIEIPTSDPTDEVINDTAALCLASKQTTTQSLNQQSSQCIAAGGTPEVNYGDQCGNGATFKCNMPLTTEQPPEPPGP